MPTPMLARMSKHTHRDGDSDRHREQEADRPGRSHNPASHVAARTSGFTLARPDSPSLRCNAVTRTDILSSSEAVFHFVGIQPASESSQRQRVVPSRGSAIGISRPGLGTDSRALRARRARNPDPRSPPRGRGSPHRKRHVRRRRVGAWIRKPVESRVPSTRTYSRGAMRTSSFTPPTTARSARAPSPAVRNGEDARACRCDRA